MSTPRIAITVLAALLAGGAAAHDAQAQEMPPYDPAIDVQLFDYAIGTKTFLTVNDAETVGNKLFSVDFLVTYLTNPFTIYNVGQDGEEILGERSKVIESMIAGQLTAAYGLTKSLQLGVAVPLIASVSGEGVNPSTGMPDPEGLSGAGVGNARLEAKLRLWESGNLRLAGALGVSLPALGGSFIGDDTVSGRGRVALQWQSGKMSAGANLGFIGRKPREIYASKIGQQLTYGAAAAYEITDQISAVAELFGRAGVPSLALDGNPLEAGAAVRYKATRAISVLAGGGGGLVRGIGAPTRRFFFSVGWAPDFRDDDDDDIANEKDKCPLLAEDKDGYEDADGCPDDDNDGDLREDAIDKCPNEKEDIDGFEDEDGCPEYDNDNDGVKDMDDRCQDGKEDGLSEGQFKTDGCPVSMTDSDGDGVMDDKDQCAADAEDVDGFEDWDGCAEMDNDKDGVADADDKCPICMEDNDGFDDVDGCPEIDNDGDGVVDADDKCPNEAETINGVKDDDGCPDAGEPMVTFDGERLLFKELLRFSTRTNRMRSASRDLVNQAARIMKLHPEVTKWVILVGIKDRNKEKARGYAQAWAEEMKSALAEEGLPADRLEALGAAADNDRYGIVAKEKQEINNDPEAMECPAGFLAVPREAPEGMNAAESSDTPSGAAESPAESGAGGAAEGGASAGGAAAGGAAQGGAAQGGASAGGAAAGGALPEAFKAYSGVVGSVEFKRNKDDLDKGEDTLDKIAELMKAHPSVHLEVGTHTDNRKGSDKSREIAQAQADKVVKHLVDKGVPAERLKAVGHGMDKPIADNDKSSGRSKNRRVEFTFTVK